MAVNPMALMKLSERMKIFNTQHPRVVPFFKTVAGKGLTPGTVVEMSVKTVSGESYVTNVKLTEDDIETIEILKNLG